MKNFKNLRVWEKSHDLTLKIYRATAEFPREELYGLTSQIRRASVSIPANIAEGCGRQSEAEFARFLRISLGSATELEYHLLLASDLNFLQNKNYANMESDLIEVKKMLVTLIQKLTANH